MLTVKHHEVLPKSVFEALSEARVLEGLRFGRLFAPALRYLVRECTTRPRSFVPRVQLIGGFCWTSQLHPNRAFPCARRPREKSEYPLAPFLAIGEHERSHHLRCLANRDALIGRRPAFDGPAKTLGFRWNPGKLKRRLGILRALGSWN